MSSSRLRLLILREMSAAEGRFGGGNGAASVGSMLGRLAAGSERFVDGEKTDDGGVETSGESRHMSSLMPEELLCLLRTAGGGSGGGGGVCDLYRACCHLATDEARLRSGTVPLPGPPLTPNASGSDISELSWDMFRTLGVRSGEEGVVPLWSLRPTSLTRTCRTTSDSRRTSLSTGLFSSCNAARIRAKFFVLGYWTVSIRANDLKTRGGSPKDCYAE